MKIVIVQYNTLVSIQYPNSYIQIQVILLLGICRYKCWDNVVHKEFLSQHHLQSSSHCSVNILFIPVPCANL